MPHPIAGGTIVAIDPRSRRLGFVVFEGPERLLDWGIKSFRRGVNAVQIPADVKLGDLMDEFLPHALVIVERDVRPKGVARMREVIFREAEKRNIAVRAFSRCDVNSAFAGSNHNKYAIAAAVIKRFPELASKRPPWRKTWEAEHPVISIFDAAAAGITYFAQHKKRPQFQSNRSDA